MPESFPWDRTLPYRSVETDLGAIVYTEIGDGPPVILLHGYGAQLIAWHHQLRALRNDAHLYALDLIGCGWSAQPHLAYTAEVFVRCLHQFMDRIGLRQATLVGNDMGAAVALCTAKYYPERIERLLLVGPTIPGVQPADRFSYWVFLLAHRGRAGERLLPPRFRWLVRLALRQAVSDATLISDELVNQYSLAMRRSGFRHVYVSTARNWHAWAEQRPRLAELKMPVRILWGEADRVHPIRQAGFLQTLLPQAEVFRLPGCGHLPQIERPVETNDALRTFLTLPPAAGRI